MSQNKFLTIPQLAKILGVSRITVYKKVKSGEIKATRVGRIFVISKNDIKSLLDNTLDDEIKKLIDEAVDKTIKDYGEVLIKLGRD